MSKHQICAGGRNWIGGEWSAAKSGHVFETRRFGPWPRSGADEVSAALEAMERAAVGWRELSPEARADRLGLVLDEWEYDGRLESDFARSLDLAEDALDEARDAALDLGDDLIEVARAPDAELFVLARASAGGLGAGLVRAVFPSLLEGHPVLLFADADAPLVAAEFCEILNAAGLPPGLVALLHDDTSTAVRAALASGRFGRLALAEPEERSTKLMKLASAASKKPRAAGGRARFGAGVTPAATPELVLSPPRQTSHIVRLADDPERAALEVCDAAFGKVRVLSGQRDGAVGRVLCHERHLSRFTAALLDAIDTLRSPCPLFDSGLAAHVEGLSRLGLDEGATLIRGSFGACSGTRRGGRDAALAPSVFTNLEPRMALAKADRPAPIISLLRFSSDEEAHALAESLSPR